jgi:iron complex transport system substrate-binding protein
LRKSNIRAARVNADLVFFLHEFNPSDMNSNLRVHLLFVTIAWLGCVSCDSRPAASPATAPAGAHGMPSITVASLTPAGTDLVIGMGAGDHLVAVSNFDFDRPGQPKLPHAGDYQNTDWERLGDLKPTIIIVQMDPDRIPAGFRDRAAAIGAKIVDIQIENLADIGKTLDQLGAALNETAKATAARARLQSRLDSVRRRVGAEPAVATLISLDERGLSAAGPGTFLDEILTIAGGKNVLAGTSTHWPSIDKERLGALSPDAVLQLLPGATPQIIQQASEFWDSMPGIPAVAQHRVFQITDDWALTPGIEVADLAEHIAASLHPKAVP